MYFSQFSDFHSSIICKVIALPGSDFAIGVCVFCWTCISGPLSHAKELCCFESPLSLAENAGSGLQLLEEFSISVSRN